MADATNNTANGGNGTQTAAAVKPQRALVPVGLNNLGMLQPTNLQEAIEIAKLIAHSGLVPKIYNGNPGAVLVAIQHGAEIGLPPMASLQSIAVINGNPTVFGDAALALVISHPDCEDVVEDDLETIKKNGKAVCVAKRRNHAPKSVTFSVEDAKTAGLWGKAGPWTNYPSRMLQMRARAFALRNTFPDILKGIRIHEEERDIVNATPEWIESDGPREGVHKFNRRSVVATVVTSADLEPTDAVIEPAHDAATGEVKDVAPVVEQKVAQEPEKKTEAPKGKAGF